jgi:hypothetical protein
MLLRGVAVQHSRQGQPMLLGKVVLLAVGMGMLGTCVPSNRHLHSATMLLNTCVAYQCILSSSRVLNTCVAYQCILSSSRVLNTCVAYPCILSSSNVLNICIVLKHVAARVLARCWVPAFLQAWR